MPGSYYGYPSILPVIATRPGWLEVRLAQRPNGSTTWVQQGYGQLGDTPYTIDVNLTTMHLSVYEDGIEVLDFPAGIGAPDDPTPPGQFFIFATVPPPDPSYGPFVLATSDHSDTIVDWENSGDALIGIHGPIDRLRRLADRHHRRGHLARLHQAARRRPLAALDDPPRHAPQHRQLSLPVASGGLDGLSHRPSWRVLCSDTSAREELDP